MSADGAVRAMVGGRKFKGVAGQFNRAIQAKRQTGSSFKPFVYADRAGPWLQPVRHRGRRAADASTIPGSGAWTPKNYDGKYRGRVTLLEALKHSLNIPAIKVAQAVGLDNVRTVASHVRHPERPGRRARRWRWGRRNRRCWR